MKIGFFGINVGACADPVVLERVARTAEAAAWRPIARMQRRDALVLGDLARGQEGWQLDLKLLRFQPKETVEQVRVTSQDPIALVDLASAAVGSALRLEDHPANDDPPLALSTRDLKMVVMAPEWLSKAPSGLRCPRRMVTSAAKALADSIQVAAAAAAMRLTLRIGFMSKSPH